MTRQNWIDLAKREAARRYGQGLSAMDVASLKMLYERGYTVRVAVDTVCVEYRLAEAA